MGDDTDDAAGFVIRATELSALNYLRPNHPRPVRLEWINRGTDQPLRQTTINMLLRTLFRNDPSPSVAKLHESSGLRAFFISEKVRDQFARQFETAREIDREKNEKLVIALFSRPEMAREVVADLEAHGVPGTAISVLWRADNFMGTGGEGYRGHSARSIAAATVAGGLFGSILGVTTLAIPGVGPVVMAGPIAAALVSQVGALGGIIGATGGAMARMLSDQDVEGREASFFETEIKQGHVFVAVDPSMVSLDRNELMKLLQSRGGQVTNRAG